MHDNTLKKNDSSQKYPWHADTWLAFSRAQANNHLPHAILLSGEEGIAKFDLAERMSKSLLCMNTGNAVSEACNECQSCKTYESTANPDFLHIGLLEDKQQISVDQVRTLSEFLTYSRSFNSYKVILINGVERMNINAANSLLKSLEEPTDNTVIILITSKLNDLLATIKSRCQIFHVHSPDKQQTIQWLEENQGAEGENTVNAHVLYNMVGSKPLKALTITPADLNEKEAFFTDLTSVIKHQISINDMAKKWEKYNFDTLINWQIHYVQTMIKNSFNILNDDQIDTQLIKHLNSEQHWSLYENLIKQKQYIHTSVNKLMFVENMITLWSKK